jgi:GDP-mannose 6-dehydrogenase
MKINVFGLGYVGCVSAACLATNGHSVTGVDTDPLKVELLNSGRSPIVEPGLEEMVQGAIAAGKLKAVTNGLSSVGDHAQVSMVCVGTPSNENGSVNLDALRRVARHLGQYLSQVNSYHVVNIRSTVIPGTIEGTIIPIIEKHAKKRVGHDFGICANPEFLREGSSLADFYRPPFTLIGELDTRSGEVVSQLYKEIQAPIARTTIGVAEMVKYACNAFHALKVSFANELGNICKGMGIDSHAVMEIFCKDNKLNLSPYYLKPGFAFGGSCLPKDLRALLYKAKELDLEAPLLSAILQGNKNQIDVAYRLVNKTGRKTVGILGLSFKAHTDDLRESPMVELAERLLGKGYQVSIYDKEVSLAKIFGSNKRYIETVIPHISSLMKNSISEVVDNSDVIIVGNRDEDYGQVVQHLNSNKRIIDLVRIASHPEELDGRYEGICW